MQLFEAVFKIFGTAFLEVVEIKVRFDRTYFDLKDLKNGSAKYFENSRKSTNFSQRLI